MVASEDRHGIDITRSPPEANTKAHRDDNATQKQIVRELVELGARWCPGPECSLRNINVLIACSGTSRITRSLVLSGIQPVLGFQLASFISTMNMREAVLSIFFGKKKKNDVGFWYYKNSKTFLPFHLH